MLIRLMPVIAVFALLAAPLAAGESTGVGHTKVTKHHAAVAKHHAIAKHHATNAKHHGIHHAQDKQHAKKTAELSAIRPDAGLTA